MPLRALYDVVALVSLLSKTSDSRGIALPSSCRIYHGRIVGLLVPLKGSLVDRGIERKRTVVQI